MVYKFYFWIFCICFLGAQSTLIAVNDKTLTLEEFENSQEKNLAVLGVDKSIELFTEFELLRQYAITEGAEQDPEFLKSYGGALKNLQKEQLIDPKLLNPALNHFYDKIKTEFKIQALYANKKDQSTIEKEIKEGKDFTSIIEQYSLNDEFLHPKYVEYQKMDDAFYNLFANLKENEISQPIPFQEDKVIWIKKIRNRPNLGLLRFQRLAVSDKKIADSIKKEVESGASFTPFVKRYSEINDDELGVVLDVISGVPDEVYEAIDNLEVGEYSEVFLFNNKYNIYRLLRRVPMRTSEERKVALLPFFKNTYEYQNLYELNLNKVDTASAYTFYPENLNDIIENASNWFADSLQYQQHTKPIFKLGNYIFTQYDALKKLNAGGLSSMNSDLMNVFIGDELYNSKSTYYENVLFYQEPRLQDTLSTIKNQLLINYAFDKIILKRSYEDKEGMQAYIEKNKDRFTLNERAQMTNYYCVNEDTAIEVEKMIRKRKNDSEILDRFKTKVDSQNRPFVIIKEGKVSENMEGYPKGVPFKKGVFLQPTGDSRYVVSHITRILPRQLMTIEEARLSLLEEYQSVYYKNILAQLKEKARIDVNEDAYRMLLSKYKK